jgi:uncharacterized membrane protein
MIAALERGDKPTRLEAFVDAAFAFALTLLVIAGDRIPGSVDELLQALKSLPAYAMSFLLILRFWTAHVDWSRRYGLDDRTTRRLSLLLVFLVLIFVYPMKMVFAVLASALTGGWLPTNFELGGLAQIPLLFVVFGVAFGSMALVMWLLYLHAWRQRDGLGLSPAERIEMRMKLWSWGAVPLVALLSIVSAWLIPATDAVGWWLGFPGFVYFSLSVLTPVLDAYSRRLQARAA